MTQDTTTTKRRPRLKRAVADPRVITERDLGIIKAVYDYRALTTHQVETLFFPPKDTRKYRPKLCGERLRFLFDQGYLDRYMQPIVLGTGTPPLLYQSTKKGTAILKEMTGDEYPYRRHEEGAILTKANHWIKTNDLRIAIEYAAAKASYEIEWIDEIELRKLHQKHKVTIVPDGFFKLTVPPSEDYPKQRVFRAFIEIDLTQTVLSFGRKVEAYNRFFGGKYEDLYQSRSIRVVTCTTSVTRLKNLKTTTEAAGGRNRYWFTTFSQLKDNMLHDQVWTMAGSEVSHSYTEINLA